MSALGGILLAIMGACVVGLILGIIEDRWRR